MPVGCIEGIEVILTAVSPFTKAARRSRCGWRGRRSTRSCPLFGRITVIVIAVKIAVDAVASISLSFPPPLLLRFLTQPKQIVEASAAANVDVVDIVVVDIVIIEGES